MTAALADYDTAIKLEPDWAEIYVYRGYLEQIKNQFDAAITDYEKAMQYKPGLTQVKSDLALAYAYRGYRNEPYGDLANAEADTVKAAELDSSLATNAASQLLSLGYLRCERQNFTNALSDFERASALNPSDTYAQLGVWLWASQLGQTQAANTALQSYLAGPKSEQTNVWTIEVGRFLNGQTTQEDLLAKADGSRDKSLYCSACFFAGSRLLISGDKMAATEFFQKCLLTDAKDTPEYKMAKTELQLLNDKKS